MGRRPKETSPDVVSPPPEKESKADQAYQHAAAVCDRLVRELDEELEGYHARRRKYAGSCDPVQP